MKLSVISFATLAAAATALDFTCDRDDVAVCCRSRDDDFEKCSTARQVTDNYRDNRHPEYHCKRNDYARCCEAHDIVESPSTVTLYRPPVTQTETIYIQPQPTQPQQQGPYTVVTVYQTYAYQTYPYTYAKVFAGAEPTAPPGIDAPVRHRKCKVLLNGK